MLRSILEEADRTGMRKVYASTRGVDCWIDFAERSLNWFVSVCICVGVNTFTFLLHIA